jgi:hypothetical protein
VRLRKLEMRLASADTSEGASGEVKRVNRFWIFDNEWTPIVDI